MLKEARDKLVREVKLDEKDFDKQTAYINGVLDFYNEIKGDKNG